MPPNETRATRLALITGLSGSGKSTVAKCFEDLGYYCVDNLPLSLLRPLLEAPESHLEEEDRVAVVTDVRAAGFVNELPGLLEEMRVARVRPTVLFLEASDETLVRRFSETRRRHPLSVGTRSRGVIEAIRAERALLAELRGVADLVFDTSGWSVHDIRREVWRRFSEDDRPSPQMLVSLTSFGFKHGIPYGTDLLFDVRFLPNPYFVEELRPLSGVDAPVREFLEGQGEFHEVIERLWSLLSYLLPRYRDEQRSYLQVAIGCTGGRHRSVAVSEQIAQRAHNEGWPVRVDHRDLARESDDKTAPPETR
jgi:UPF0042 nucleotide-binding protein